MNKIYEGAIINCEFSHCSLVPPKGGNYQWFDAAQMFPKSNEEFPVENFLPGRVMLNDPNAPSADALTISRTEDGSLCARMLCMAHSLWGKTPLNNNKGEDDNSKAKGGIGLYLTSQELRLGQPKSSLMVSVMLSNRKLPSSFRPPLNTIIVSRTQLTGFYGRSFAPHLEARIKSTRPICTLARSTPTLAATQLCRCFRVGVWTLKHL